MAMRTANRKFRIAFPALLVCLCLLAACAPFTAPPGLEPTAPTIDRDAFLTRDGQRLPLRRWQAEHPRAVIVALHGINDYSNAFAMPAPWWAERGITTYAYDQRGFGGAPYLGLWPGGDALRRDLADCVAVVRRHHPGLPVFVLGESMGGAVALSALASATPPDADGVILVAPAVWSRTDMPWSYRAALYLTAHIAPDLQLTGKGLKIWPSDNIAMLRRYALDLRVLKRTRADEIWGLADLMDEARAAPGKLADPPPLLLLYGAHDQIVPAAPTEATIKALGHHVEAHKFPDGYHMLLRDLHGQEAWQAVATWIDVTPSARP
jgi:acylglycerol lipase